MYEEEDFPSATLPVSAASIVMDDDAEDDIENKDEDDAYDDPTTPSIQRQRRKSNMGANGGGGRRRRRRRSSARFLRLTPNDDGDDQDLLMEGTLNSTLMSTSLVTNGNPTKSSTTSLANLGEMYQKAIRMNAENRINATNSWNLSLIDHLDRFISHDMDDGITTVGGDRANNYNSNNNNNNNRGGGRSNSNSNRFFANTNNNMEETLTTASLATGINFTKASCTLDASVKIYSYRVDDVHLSSYRVLANLNRTDNGKDGNNNNKNGTTSAVPKNDNNGNVDADDDDAAVNGNDNRSSKKSDATTETLEHNLANINIHKLDAAFDIDPLFHKMSKTFDEGGAKGLLLANLGVSRTGCNIVFDSTLDDEQDTVPAAEDSTMNGNETGGPVDISTLVSKLDSMLSALGQSIQQVPLVPQLASLRQEYAILEEEGYIEQDKPTDRYASSPDEEVEADRSIHLEALERSRASVGRSFLPREHDYRGGSVRSSLDSNPDHYAPDDFGGGADDFDDGNDNDDYGVSDGVFGKSLIHDGDHRFSSSSFQSSSFVDPQQSQPSQATVLLDAIASGEISTLQSNNPYEYFNSQALYKLSSLSGGNLWAGSEHWKKVSSSTIKRRKPVTGPGKDDTTLSTAGIDGKKTKGRKTKGGNKGGDRPALVDITRPVENLDELFRQPMKGGGRSRKTTTNDPLLLTKTMKAKYGKVDNLLPLDAGLGIEQLTTLFLRPRTNLADTAAQRNDEAAIRRKTVGFSGVETMGGSNNSSDPYEENDDYDGGTGFDFGTGGGDDYDDTHDFVIPVLEDVRKVEKIRVGYATVAKKVDVKRLKMDLWTELERTFQNQKGNAEQDTDGREEADESTKQNGDDDDDVEETLHGADESCIPLSFQATLRDMETTQSQRDVTLPFYFICILHLCNEKGLALESCGLHDFVIRSS